MGAPIARTRSNDYRTRTNAKSMVVCLVATLAGCASPLPEVVRVPVPVACIQGMVPEKPQTISHEALLEIARTDEYGATLQVFVDWLALKAYAERAAALIEGCR